MQPNQRKLIIALLKAQGLGILDKSDYEVSEYVLAQKINESDVLKTLSVAKTATNKVLLVWKSKIGQTIACDVSADGFNFNSLGCYYSTENNLIVPVYSRYYEKTDKGKIIDEEAQEIKKLIIEFNESLEKLFY